jgi:hypothetical protein
VLHPEDLADQDFVMHYQLYNSYLETIVRIQYSPYFVKYLLSKKPMAAPGKRLPAVLAQRLLDLAPHLDRRMQFGTRFRTRHRARDFYQKFANNSIKLLHTLLSIFSKMPDRNAVVPLAVQQGLLPWLELWDQRYSSDDLTSSDPEACLGLNCWLLWAHLSPEIDITRDIKFHRRHLKRADYYCALPSCSVKHRCKVCAK